MTRHHTLPLVGLMLIPLALATSCAERGASPTGTAAPPVASPAEGRLQEGALLSSFDLGIDLVAASATLTPHRAATAIGDTYSELGLAPAFTEMFGRNFEVLGLRHSGSGDVEVDFRIRHPFAPAIRPDLAIFNVKAWVVSDEPATNLAGVATVPDLVTNAAGYGRMWLDTAASAPAFAAAPVQPYILMREDTGSDPFNYQQPAGFNVLFPGMTSEATLALRLTPASQVRFRIYLTADYGQSAVRATRQNPQYELPQFAGNAPWKINVTELANSLEAGDPTSSAEYKVDIWDWKHGYSLGSDVVSATLEIPGVTAGPLTLSLSGTGQDPSPLTATTFVVNTSNAAEGEYWGLVTVTDQAAAGVGLLEDLRTPVTITSYTTYQCFPVQVTFSPLGDPPIAVLSRACPGEAVAPGALISLDGSGSLPGSSAIVDYEWDFDYDGSLFQIDATGALVSTSYPSETTKVIALRVRAADAQTDLATTLVTVLPTAAWGAPVRLTNTFSQKELFDTSQNTSNALSVGPDGRVHLTWFTQLPYQVWHQSFMPSPTPIIWDTPEMIYSSGGGGLGHVSCQTGPDNVTHVMYTLNSAGRPRQSVSKSGGTWSAPATVPASIHPGQWDRCLMIGNAAGTMGFLGQWSRGDQPPAGSGLPALPNDMYFSTLNAGVWSPLTRIGGADVVTSEGGSARVPSHALVGTADGEWLAVWESLYTPFPGGPTGVPSLCKLIWSQTSTGSWPAEGTDLYNDGPDYDLPILARSPNGRIWLGARIGSSGDAWGLVTYEGGSWSPSFTQIFSPTGVTFSRLPCTQFSFDSQGRGCLLVSYREPTAPVQAKFFLQDDTLPTIAACTQQVIEPGLTGVGKPMCQIASHGDGRYTAIWLTTKYNPGNPYTENTEIEYATWE